MKRPSGLRERTEGDRPDFFSSRRNNCSAWTTRNWKEDLHISVPDTDPGLILGTVSSKIFRVFISLCDMSFFLMLGYIKVKQCLCFHSQATETGGQCGNILIVLQRHPARLLVLCNMLTDLMGGINLQFEQLVITRYDLMSQFLLQICLQWSKTKLRRRCEVWSIPQWEECPD